MVLAFSRNPIAFLVVTLLMVGGCATRMTAEEFNKRFGVPDSLEEVDRLPPEDAADTVEARRDAAERFLTRELYERFVDTMIHDLAKELPEDRRPAFFKIMRDVWPPDYREQGLDSMVRRFPKRQLETMIVFAATSEGRAWLTESTRISGPTRPPEAASDSAADRKVAAQRLLQAMDHERAHGAEARIVCRRLSYGAIGGASAREVDLERCLRTFADGYRGQEAKNVDQLAKYLTRRELDATRRFYDSPDGRTIYLRTKLVDADLFPVVLEMMRRAEELARQRR